MNWDEYFLSIAEVVSKKSKDPSTKVGCVIVSPDHDILSTGYNGFASGVFEVGTALQGEMKADGDASGIHVVDFAARWERPEKYDWVIHAEHNAILRAARRGVKMEGATLYIQYDCPPCAGCCDAIIQAGIKTVISGVIPFPGKGKGVHYDVADMARTKLREAQVHWYPYRRPKPKQSSHVPPELTEVPLTP